MKKAVSLLLAAMMVLASVSCFAATPEATVHEVQNNVYIEGKVDEFIEDEPLVITLEDAEGKMVYISEYEIDATGKYAIKFKYNKSLSGLKLNLRYGDELVTDSAVTATATSQIVEADVFVTDENDRSYDEAVDKTKTEFYFGTTVNDYLGTVEGLPEHTYVSDYSVSDREGLKAVVNIKNKYADEENISVMVAAYDENNKLLDCKVEDVATEYGEDGKIQAVDSTVIDVPENTVTAKAFCWSSASNLIPLGEQADGSLDKIDIFCIGDSFCQGYGRRFYPESGWGEHLIDYFNTKYITVTNYGTSGAWAQSVLSNENDPVYQANVAAGNKPTSGMYGWGDWDEMENDSKFSKGDYVIVSLGLNDSGKPGPDGMLAVDWYGLGIEEMIKRCEEKEVNLILCSAMLRANAVAPAATKELIARTEEIAKKYNVTYLDVNDALEKQYAEEFGYLEDATAIENAIYSKYYLYRDAFKDENHEFYLTDDERANHAQDAMKDDHTTGKNSHPNLRGADNMARQIAELLKDTDSNLRFYVR